MLGVAGENLFLLLLEGYKMHSGKLMIISGVLDLLWTVLFYISPLWLAPEDEDLFIFSRA